MTDQLSNDLASLRIARSEPRPSKAGAIARVLAVVVALGALVVGAIVGWPYAEARIFATTVDIGTVASVSPAEDQTQLTAAGHVVARTLAHVATSVPGRVARVHVVEGQE